jgi:branched-chain amino acid aminotransferase
MAIVVNVNGRIGGEEQAVISVLDHGFLYGEGIYEVVRTYNRQPFLLDRHLQRLRRSADMIALQLPMSDAGFEAEVVETLRAYFADAGNASVANAYIRILVTRGVGEITYDPTSCTRPSVVIIVKALTPRPAWVYEQGVKCSLVSVVRNHPCSINPLIKSNNLLNNALAAQEALRKGAFEAILRNYRGELAECSTANLFILKDGLLMTPPLDSGLLSGITRGFIFEVCKSAGFDAEQRVLHDDDLFDADECFFTSTTQEVVPIVQVDDRTIGSGKPGATTLRLLEEFRRQANAMTCV